VVRARVRYSPGMLVTPLSPTGVPRLGVNVDHVATVRQARRGDRPDPVECALLAESAGADGITVHLREDRRHVQERDVRVLRSIVRHLNLEIACEPAVVRIAEDIRPHAVCLVPERREEVTTEGGLDCTADPARVAAVVERLAEGGAVVSVFIDPDVKQLRAAREAGAAAVELHTGRYADAPPGRDREQALAELTMAAAAARELGLIVHAGHGLDYKNVGPVARIAGVVELNIGHAIVARALAVGFERAVREMGQAMSQAIGGTPRGEASR